MVVAMVVAMLVAMVVAMLAAMVVAMVEESDPGAGIGSPRSASSARAWAAHRRCRAAGRPRALCQDLAREWVPPEATGHSRSRVLR